MACPLCERCEREYEDKIRAIYAVLNERFDSPAEKLQKLHRLQDQRDVAVEKFYKHKKTHPRKRFDEGETA